MAGLCLFYLVLSLFLTPPGMIIPGYSGLFWQKGGQPWGYTRGF